MMLGHGREVAELFRRVNNLLRVGKTVSINYAAARAKIGEITTDFLLCLTPSPAVYIPVKNSEQVVVLSPCWRLAFWNDVRCVFLHI
jgi:hypothetical protein